MVVGNREAGGEKRTVEELVTQTANTTGMQRLMEEKRGGRQEVFSAKHPDTECSTERHVPEGFA